MQPNARFLLCLYAPIEQFVVAAIKDIYSFWFVLLMEIYIEFDLFNVIALIWACKAKYKLRKITWITKYRGILLIQ